MAESGPEFGPELEEVRFHDTPSLCIYGCVETAHCERCIDLCCRSARPIGIKRVLLLSVTQHELSTA